MRRVRGRATRWLLAAWVAATLLAQHPQREFDRLRHVPGLRLLIPDWRFFVPQPTDRDLVPVVRTRPPDGEWTRWERLFAPVRRRWWQILWFPAGRELHAVLDIAREVQLLPASRLPDLRRSAAFRILHERAAGASRPGDVEGQLAIIAEAPYATAPTAKASWVSPPFPLPDGREKTPM